MNRFYFINYNNLFFKDTNSLIEIFLDLKNPLRIIAKDILVNDNRLFDNSLEEALINKIIDKLYLEDLWYLASFNRKYLISKLCFNKIMIILDEYDVIERRRLIKVLK